MANGIFHYHRYRHKHKSAKHSAYDTFMTVVATVYPAMGLPQVLQIFGSHSVQGVSLLSWVGFMLFGLVFLVYGLIKKLVPLIITEVLWLLVDAAIVIGVLMYR